LAKLQFTLMGVLASSLPRGTPPAPRGVDFLGVFFSQKNDGGLSRGSSMRRPGIEDHIGASRNVLSLSAAVTFLPEGVIVWFYMGF
jgi:hypothetical protein